ncbi:hypothetical protein I7I51_06344 [Histoplasma capsulatum]|uniref:Uncharacterized protein n=1 Tax=Ajellomyces capsulatus TaxID=5037 RepID=A0A8A1MK56_AJECA|nr:hypothetical protein I7I51_06344 [Histoplasma capsulatum]
MKKSNQLWSTTQSDLEGEQVLRKVYAVCYEQTPAHYIDSLDIPGADALVLLNMDLATHCIFPQYDAISYWITTARLKATANRRKSARTFHAQRRESSRMDDILVTDIRVTLSGCELVQKLWDMIRIGLFASVTAINPGQCGFKLKSVVIWKVKAERWLELLNDPPMGRYMTGS